LRAKREKRDITFVSECERQRGPVTQLSGRVSPHEDDTSRKKEGSNLYDTAARGPGTLTVGAWVRGGGGGGVVWGDGGVGGGLWGVCTIADWGGGWGCSVGFGGHGLVWGAETFCLVSLWRVVRGRVSVSFFAFFDVALFDSFVAGLLDWGGWSLWLFFVLGGVLLAMLFLWVLLNGAVGGVAELV